MESVIELRVKKRQCGDCTKCCEGWLEADIYGHKMFPGQSCHFLEKGCNGCTIYSQRPQDPCKEYSCEWLDNSENFPEWLKPSNSGVIITKRIPPEGEEHAIYHVVETGKKMDSSVLNWLIHWALKNQVNIQYQIEGKFHTMLTQRTSDKMSEIENLKKL